MNNQFEVALDELADGPVAMQFGDQFVGVFGVNGNIYAIENVCPHAQALLTDGHVSGAVIECGLHNARFHIPTGKCLNGPGRDIATFPVRVTDKTAIVTCEPR